MTTRAAELESPGGARTVAPPAWRTRAWAIVGALSVTETVSWGVLYYAFAVFLVPMQYDLGYSAAQLTGAFSIALLVAGLAGIAVGRHLDRHGPRALMTGGSIAGVALVLSWSQVDDLAAFYLLWAALGLVMAAVLYEPAFAVLAKQFPVAEERRRAMTAMTLVAALASFIFLPLAQALIDAHGWRDALVILAVILAIVTVPLHGLVLRAAPARSSHHVARSVGASAALRSPQFWLLCGAFFLASIATIAITVHAIPFLLERGYGPGFAAFAVGLIGVSQIPGRLLYGFITSRVAARWARASVFALIALGIALVVGLDSTWAVVAGLVVLGMGNGMTTLARATMVADLYAPGAYGTIASVAALAPMIARATGPFAAAVYAASVGYGTLLWTLVALGALAAALAYRASPAR